MSDLVTTIGEKSEIGVWYSLDGILLDYACSKDETKEEAANRLGEPVVWGKY